MFLGGACGPKGLANTAILASYQEISVKIHSIQMLNYTFCNRAIPISFELGCTLCVPMSYCLFTGRLIAILSSVLRMNLMREQFLC